MERTKKPLIIGIVAGIVIVGLVVARIVWLNLPEEQSAQEAIEVTEAPASEEIEETTQAYSAEQQEFIELLSSEVFTDGGGENYLIFSDSSFNQYVNGSLNAQPYALSSLKTETLSSPEATVERTSATLTTNGSTYMFSADIDPSTGKIASVTCDVFALQPTWIMAEKTGAIQVSDPQSDVVDLIGGRTNELKKAVEEYCNQNRPLAISAVPSGSVNVNYDTHTVMLTYALLPTTQKPITVTYDQNDQTFVVSEV